MKPQRILDCVTTPDGGEIVLYQRGDAFVIHIDNFELMTSRAHGSEEALARLALDALDAPGRRPAPRVLVGGLGMGFTLRAALDCVAGRPGARVVVAEFFPAVVEWNRRYLGQLAGEPLADPRVEVALGDIARPIAAAAAAAAYDAILLDVDNGAEALTLEGNRHLYTQKGVARLHRALTPGGVLAVWSTDDDPRFTDRLTREGFTVTTHRAAARPGGKGTRHVIFVARRG